MNADGTGERQLTTTGGDGFPAWSPDGRQVAFVGGRDTSGISGEIYVMNDDGSAQTRLTGMPRQGRSPRTRGSS
jgi:Tol biopolymer transport system component